MGAPAVGNFNTNLVLTFPGLRGDPRRNDQRSYRHAKWLVKPPHANLARNSENRQEETPCPPC